MPENPKTHPRKNPPNFSLDAQRRIQEKATTLASHLKNCSKIELEILVRYYIQGEDAVSISAKMKIDPERLAALRARLRKLLVSGPIQAKSAAAGRLPGC